VLSIANAWTRDRFKASVHEGIEYSGPIWPNELGRYPTCVITILTGLLMFDWRGRTVAWRAIANRSSSGASIAFFVVSWGRIACGRR